MYLKIVVLASILLAVGIIVLLLISGMWNPFPQEKFQINTSRTAVITEIKQLQRMETAQYTVEKIIEAGTTEGNAFQNVLFGDKILLIAQGKVVAGIDFANLAEKDIDTNGTSATLRLPAPEIFFTTIDNQKTKVYDRKLGVLAKGDKDLEAEARQKAELTIKQAACDAGILKEASDNAKKQLTILLTALNFEQVTIQIPAGKC